MYHVKEIVGMNASLRESIVATAPDFDAAKAIVTALGVAFMEDDADYPGCADAYLSDGRVVAIQPKGFTL